MSQNALSDVSTIVGSSRRTFNSWRKLPVANRVALLTPALDYFRENSETIAREITASIGRPIKHSRNEISGLQERATYLLSIAEDTLKPEILPKEGFSRAIVHEPLGVVFIMSAWNYPLLITINGVMAALLAGNVVLLKHASLTTGMSAHFERAFGNIPGFPGLVRSVTLDHATTEQVIESGLANHVIFTGSVAGGRAIYQSAAKALIDCNLELGGKDGAYVAEDADIAKAADGLVDGAMYNSGQSCCGVERVYVHEKVYGAFLVESARLINQYVLGDPNEESTTLGPLAKASAATLLEAQIKEAVTKGAKVVRGGKKREIDGRVFFEPTLLTNVTQDMAIMREENFGPIMPVMKVSSEDEAIAHINDSRYGLTSIIYTTSEERAERFFEQTDAGTIFMNRCDYLDPALPWTGVRDSGIGSALSKYGILGLTRRKAKHFRL